VRAFVRFLSSPGLLGAAIAALAATLSWTPSASAQAFPRLAVTSYWVDYSRSAHAFSDALPLAPQLTEGTPWVAMRGLLMRDPGAQTLYLIGDDRLHVSPGRVGILGWGLSAGIRF